MIRAGKSQFSKPADVTVSGVTQPLGLPLVAPLVDGKLPVDTAEATVQLADIGRCRPGPPSKPIGRPPTRTASQRCTFSA
ncbi:hypothetical protein V5O39_12465 [Pseudomonas parakoreensis]